MKKITVLVIDDSFFMRKFLTEIIESDRDIKVVGNAKNGKEGLEMVKTLSPDVVTLDYEMPYLNGIQTLERIMEEKPTPCIMVSAYTKEDADLTFEALKKGAFDFVPKPSGELSLDIVKVKDLLIQKIKSAKNVKREKLLQKFDEIENIKEKRQKRFEGVGIASSTGGPQIVEYIIKNSPPDTKAYFFIVQHMPQVFTQRFAQRLKETTGKKVKETEDGEEIEEKTFYIAKGGYHLILKRQGKTIKLCHEKYDYLHGVRPSADYLFSSMAEVFEDKALCIVLTGMGKDGCEGAKKIKEKGGEVWIQDKNSSLIFGMPKVIYEQKLMDRVLSPKEIVQNLYKVI